MAEHPEVHVHSYLPCSRWDPNPTFLYNWWIPSTKLLNAGVHLIFSLFSSWSSMASELSKFNENFSPLSPIILLHLKCLSMFLITSLFILLQTLMVPSACQSLLLKQETKKSSLVGWLIFCIQLTNPTKSPLLSIVAGRLLVFFLSLKPDTL